MTNLQLEKYSSLIYEIVGAAYEVHRVLHFGLAEAVYEEALCIEMKILGLDVNSQVDLPVFYKNYKLEKHYRLDIIVESDIVIELKALETILPEHRAQLFNYLRITKKPIGLLINFGKSVNVEKYVFDVEQNDVSFFRY